MVEKSAEDPGAAFTPEVLDRLVALKAEDRASFEAMRARLKKAGCRVTALDEAMAEESGDGGRGPTQADILIDLAGAAELFHSADGTALERAGIAEFDGGLPRPEAEALAFECCVVEWLNRTF